MDQINKSMQLLRLTEGFDHDALDTAYRNAAVALRGVPVDQQEAILRAINEARDRLRTNLGPRASSALIRRVAWDIAPMPAMPQGELERRAAASERTVNTVVTQGVGRLAAVRQQRFTVAFLMGGLAVAGVLVRLTVPFIPESYAYFWRETIAWGAGAAALIGGIFGALGWAVKGREQWLTLQIEGVASALSDRAALSDTLGEIDAGTDWTLREFCACVASWIDRQREQVFVSNIRTSARMNQLNPYARIFRSLGLLAPRDAEVEMWRVAARIGPNDFTSIVLAKGVETRIVEEAVIRNASGIERYGYRRAPITLS